MTAGEDVIVETTRGLEYGQCVQGNTEAPDRYGCPAALSAWCAWRLTRSKKTLARNKKRDG